MLMKRKLRTRLDAIRPNIQVRVDSKQFSQKVNHDKHTKLRTFNTNDSVYAENYATGPRWIAGLILERVGSCMFTVQLDDGRVWRRHVDQLRPRQLLVTPPINDPIAPVPIFPRREEEDDRSKSSSCADNQPEQPTDQSQSVNNSSNPDLRRSTRTHNKPPRYRFHDY
jgi:hypothetical protein